MKKSKELWERMATWVEENGLIEDGGASLKQFCAFFSIDNKSFYRWMEIADFADLINHARVTFRENLEREIVMSLARAAKGYTYISKHEKTIIEDNGEGQPTIKGSQKWKKEVNVEPNVQAATWLLPRLSDKWNITDKHDVKVSGSGVTIICENKEQEDILKRLEKKCRG